MAAWPLVRMGTSDAPFAAIVAVGKTDVEDGTEPLQEEKWQDVAVLEAEEAAKERGDGKEWFLTGARWIIIKAGKTQGMCQFDSLCSGGGK